MSTFGWCLSRHHKDCIRKFQRYVWTKTRVKRTMVETFTATDEWIECDCKCHRKDKK